MEDINKKIDNLLKIRQEGMFDYSRSTNELIELGVKIGHKSDGGLTLPSSFEPYLDKYERSNLEFEWQAIDKDGSILNQFEEGVQHSFKDIKLDSIKSIAFISNFNWPTDNKETRVIVRLNMETGSFEIMNGFAPREVKEILCVPEEGEKKLILFARKRFSATQGEINEKYADFFPMKDEFLYYNRFVLGYEVPRGNKKLAIIGPTGIISLFEK